jgi:hypothetical protein
MPRIQLPDGTIGDFPDSMSDAEIKGVLVRKFPPPSQMAWGDVAGQAMRNAPASLYRYGADIGNAVMHPIATGDAMLDLAAGGISRGIEGATGLDIFPENKATATADVVGKMYKDRYGSVGGFKNAVATDPIGVLSDISLPFTGGGGLAAKAPGVIGKVGRVAKVAGELMDPISATTRVAKVTRATRIPSAAFGAWTGAGEGAIQEAYDAAKAGGTKKAAFYDNMRGNVPIEDVVSEAKVGLNNIENKRRTAYQTNIQSTKQSTAPVNFQPIAQAFSDAVDSMHQGGMWTGGEASTAMAKKLHTILDTWSKSPSAHTPWGIDGLKKRLSGLVKTMGPGVDSDVANANRLAETVRSAAEAQVKAADPKYAATMQGYAGASKQIDELQRTLSLHDKASVDTTLRKLQSTMRNNVNTNYGSRVNLVKELEKNGAETLMPALAGQSMNSWAPRGLARVLASPGAAGAAALTYMNPAMWPWAAAAVAGAAASSPRLVGEVAGLLGNTAPAREVVGPVAKTAVRKIGEALPFIEDANSTQYDAEGNIIGRGNKKRGSAAR